MKSKEFNNANAKELKLRKQYSHEAWLKRQEEFHKIIKRDCYGIKSRKI